MANNESFLNEILECCAHSKTHTYHIPNMEDPIPSSAAEKAFIRKYESFNSDEISEEDFILALFELFLSDTQESKLRISIYNALCEKNLHYDATKISTGIFDLIKRHEQNGNYSFQIQNVHTLLERFENIHLPAEYMQSPKPVINTIAQESIVADSTVTIKQLLAENKDHDQVCNTWLSLLNDNQIAADANIMGHTFISFWTMVWQKKETSIFKKTTNGALFAQFPNALFDLFRNPVFTTFSIEKKITLLSMYCNQATLKTPLQQLALNDTTFTDQRTLIKQLIIYLIKLPASLEHEKDDTWFDILFRRDPHALLEIMNAVVDNRQKKEITTAHMFNHLYQNGAHLRLFAQLRDPWILTPEQRAIESIRYALIEKIMWPAEEWVPYSAIFEALESAKDVCTTLSKLSQNTHALTFHSPNEKVNVLIRAVSGYKFVKGPSYDYIERLNWLTSQPAIKNHSFTFYQYILTHTVHYLIQLASHDHCDDHFYINEMVPFFENYYYKFTQAISKGMMRRSIIHSLALLIVPDTLFYRDPYLMVDKFITLIAHLDKLLACFNLTMEELLKNEKTQTILDEVLAKMLRCATPDQYCKITALAISYSLQDHVKIKAVMNAHMDLEVNKTNDANAAQNFASQLKLAAQDHVKSRNKADKSCAHFIIATFSEAYSTNGHIMFSITGIAKSMLKIIDYRISTHHQNEKTFENGFYQSLHGPHKPVLTAFNPKKIDLSPYKIFFIEQITLSLKKLGNIPYTDTPRIKSLWDSIQFFMTKLSLLQNEFDTETQNIFNQLYLFYPERGESSDGMRISGQGFELISHRTINADTADFVNAKTHDHFMSSIMQKAQSYKENPYHRLKYGNTESLRCAESIANLNPAWETETEQEDQQSLLCAKTIMHIISFRIICYNEGSKYEKSLYTDPDGFKVQLEKLYASDNKIILSKTQRIAMQTQIKTLLSTPGFMEKQDDARRKSLLADFQLWIPLFNFDSNEINNMLIDSGFGDLASATTTLSITSNIYHPKSSAHNPANNTPSKCLVM